MTIEKMQTKESNPSQRSRSRRPASTAAPSGCRGSAGSARDAGTQATLPHRRSERPKLNPFIGQY